MLAFTGTSVTKLAILKQLRAHAKSDEIVKGQYWKAGKGCAVGCTIHGSNHALYESHFGVPQMLARLEDCIFEGLPNAEAKKWPVRFMSAIQPGADLSRVGWQFLHWLLTDEKVNPGINHPLVCGAIRQCADVLAPLTKGKPTDKNAADSAWSAAKSAEADSAWSAVRSPEWSAARSAEWSAAKSAESAKSAADSAKTAADSAERSAAWSAAESAESAADSAAWSAGGSAAWSAWSAARSAAKSAEGLAEAAKSAAYLLMAKKFITLIKAAPK